MQESKVVMYESDESAKFVTVTGWVSRDGRFFGDDEHTARYSGSTHFICECGGVGKRGYTVCDKCVLQKENERYDKLEYMEWDGETPLTEWGNDEYFYSEEDIESYCDNEDIDPSTLRLVIGSPVRLPGLDIEDYLYDSLAEDQECDDADILYAVELLNKALKKKGNFCWEPGNKRTVVELTMCGQDCKTYGGRNDY
jgi:hypothetical protein